MVDGEFCCDIYYVEMGYRSLIMLHCMFHSVMVMPCLIYAAPLLLVYFAKLL